MSLEMLSSEKKKRERESLLLSISSFPELQVYPRHYIGKKKRIT